MKRTTVMNDTFREPRIQQWRAVNATIQQAPELVGMRSPPTTGIESKDLNS